MLQQTVLDRSWRVLIIEEHDRRLVGSHPQTDETAWQDYLTVLQRLRRVSFEVVVAKPLVESARAVELMTAADPVKAIWMLRHYDGVARSSVNRFGTENPFRDLQPFCIDDQLDWRSAGATKKTRETVVGLLSEGLSPLDAAALFWWARNQLYFEQHLGHDERIRIIRYDEPAIAPMRWSRHSRPTSGSPCPRTRLPPRCARSTLNERHWISTLRSIGSVVRCGTPSQDFRRSKGEWICGMGRSGSIIPCYHRVAEGTEDPFQLCVTPSNFAAHLDEIARHGEPSTLAELPMPSRRPRVVVTFDDGYVDNLTNALPIAEAKGIPIDRLRHERCPR